MKKALIFLMILSVLALGLEAHCLELPILTPKNDKPIENNLDDTDLCTMRYVQGMTTQAFYEGKEEARSSQITDLKIENLILKVALIYVAVNR